MRKLLLVVLVLTMLVGAPSARAEIGASCAYNGTQPGILVRGLFDNQEVCVLDTPSCNPETDSCLVPDCDPTTSSVSCIQEKPAARTGTQSGFQALAPIPGLTRDTETSVINSDSLADFFNNLYLYVIGLAAAAAIIQIIYAGLQIAVFNQDSVSKITDSKGRISRSIQGLILILTPVVVFSIINPSILNLELNLPPLDTKTIVPPAPKTTTTEIGDKTITQEVILCSNNDCAAARQKCFDKSGVGETYYPLLQCVDSTTLKVGDQPAIPRDTPNPSCPSGMTLVVACTSDSSPYEMRF